MRCRLLLTDMWIKTTRPCYLVVLQIADAAKTSSQADDLYLDDTGSGGYYPEDDDDFNSGSGSGKFHILTYSQSLGEDTDTFASSAGNYPEALWHSFSSLLQVAAANVETLHLSPADWSVTTSLCPLYLSPVSYSLCLLFPSPPLSFSH